jgi:signal transduction histidine kinase
MAARAPASTADQLGGIVSEIDRVIAQVRSTIYELGMGDDSRGVRDDITNLTRELQLIIGCKVDLTFSGPLDSGITGQLLDHLLATIREALTNVGKHAHATHASLSVVADDTWCTLTITDDGVGITGRPAAGGGLGLPNLRRRAEKLHGTLAVDAVPGGGTQLTWTVPLSS